MGTAASWAEARGIQWTRALRSLDSRTNGLGIFEEILVNCSWAPPRAPRVLTTVPDSSTTFRACLRAGYRRMPPGLIRATARRLPRARLRRYQVSWNSPNIQRRNSILQFMYSIPYRKIVAPRLRVMATTLAAIAPLLVCVRRQCSCSSGVRRHPTRTRRGAGQRCEEQEQKMRVRAIPGCTATDCLT